MDNDQVSGAPKSFYFYNKHKQAQNLPTYDIKLMVVSIYSYNAHTKETKGRKKSERLCPCPLNSSFVLCKGLWVMRGAVHVSHPKYFLLKLYRKDTKGTPKKKRPERLCNKLIK